MDKDTVQNDGADGVHCDDGNDGDKDGGDESYEASEASGGEEEGSSTPGHESAEGVDDDPRDDGLGDESRGEDDDPPEPPAGPFMKDDGTVCGPDETPWGRVSVIRPGALDESLSVYCRMHGCTVCKRISRGVPSQAAIVRWFQRGQAMPRGRTAYLQNAHKRSFPSPEE